MIDVRHVQVEAGIHTIGEAAWQHCNRLLIVQLPNTVVCLQDGAFQRNYVLHTVSAPGCKYFGLWVFEECYALAQIGDQSMTFNQLAPQARFRTRAFEKCSSLQQLSFERTEYDSTELYRSIPEGCFFEAGIESLFLPTDFNWMGPAACEHCKRLRVVDISQTKISEILQNTSEAHWARRPPKLHLLGRATYPTHPGEVRMRNTMHLTRARNLHSQNGSGSSPNQPMAKKSGLTS